MTTGTKEAQTNEQEHEQEPDIQPTAAIIDDEALLKHPIYGNMPKRRLSKPANIL